MSKKEDKFKGYANEDEFNRKFACGKYKNRKEMLEKMEAPDGCSTSKWANMPRHERSQHVKAHPECVEKA